MGDSNPMDVLIEGAAALELPLSSVQTEMFGRYSELLLDWNSRINLTHITAPVDVQRKHFLDSLTCCLALNVGDALPLIDAWAGKRFIDVGTGAGFPGLPLKIVMPDIQLTLLEATGKKTQFLQAVVSELGLGDVDVVTGRAEEAAHQIDHRHSYEVVLARALAPMATLVEFTLPFLQLGGTLVAQKGEDPRTEVADADYAIETLGGRLRQVSAVAIPGLQAARHLVQIDKIGPTPDRYPRRPGMPKKRPLTKS